MIHNSALSGLILLPPRSGVNEDIASVFCQYHNQQQGQLESQATIASCSWTHGNRYGYAGGLTENDFILASKINDLDTSDLRPRPKAKVRNFV